MNKFGLKRLLTIVGISIFVTVANAQLKVGDNSNVINSNSVLELESTNKGMLLPRLALTSTTAAAPLSAHVAGMTIYNTATAGSSPTDVAPGYYYNDGTKWVRIATSSSSAGALNTTASSLITITNGTGATFTAMVVGVDTTALKNFIGTSVSKTTSGGNLITITNGVGAALKDNTVAVDTTALKVFLNNKIQSTTSAPITGNGTTASPITMTPANFATFSAQSPVKDSIQSYATQVEPWFNVATNKGATANTQNIYQMGSVGIGTNNPTKQLDVFSNGTTYVKVRGNGPGYTNATVELVATGAPNARGTGISMTDSIANNQWYVGRPYSGGTGNGNDVFVVQRKSSPLAGDDAAGHYTGGGLPNASNFFSIINNGNTGISSVNPTNKLDVNGDARVRVMADGATTDSVVTRDVNGVLRKRPANYLLNNLAPATNTLRDSILVNQGGNLRYNLSDCYEFNELVAPSQMQVLMKVGATGYVGEGVAQYSFTVGNYTSGHSGTKTYIFGGGYTHGAMVIGQWYKLEPSMVGNGHGYGLDSMTFLVRNDDNYSHSFAIANGATGTNFNYYITACDMNPSFTNRLNFTVADSSATAQRPYSYTGTQQSPISKAIGNITVKNVSVNIPATMLGVRYTSTISVSGANIGDNVIVNPRTALPNGIGIAYSRVSAANTIEIGFNGTGSDPAATVIFDIKILK